ncbi:hypothetical protein Tco_0427648 [Tanacetum coccineum]
MIHLSLRLEITYHTSSSSYASSTWTAYSPRGSTVRNHLMGRTHDDRKEERRRSPMTSVPALSPVSGALSPCHADLIPSPKRVRDSGYLTDRFMAEIDGVFLLTQLLFGVEVRCCSVVEAIDRDETETGVRGPVEVRVERVTHPVMPEDIPEPSSGGSSRGLEGVQREQGHRMVGVESAESHGYRPLEYARKCLAPGSGNVMTREEFEELVTRRVAEERMNEGDTEEMEMEEMEMEGKEGKRKWKQKWESGYELFRGFIASARECTFQDFLKCKPYNFSGTEGIVGLTRWFEKMETVFNISNCPSKYQVKYATCTLQDSALTWWNSHKRTIGG